MLPINRMRCEYLCQPLGVDTPAPYLSWAVSSACGGNADARVLVSYEEDFSSLLWDSGWTARQCAVTYAGEPLRSGSRVWWKVLIRPAGQEDSIAEGVSWFETGLMRETDWHGQWIRADAPCEAPVLLRTFPLEHVPDKARVYLCGLGFFELFVNGRRAGNEVLQPVWTAYSPQPQTGMLYPYHYEGTYRTPYRVFSLDGLLQTGSNRLEVHLGNGWYHQNQRCIEGNLWYGETPVLLLELRMDGQVLVSDTNWQWRESSVVRNNIFYGEEIDHTRPCGPLRPVCAAPAPEGRLKAQECPSDAPQERYRPLRAWETQTERLILDFGQNLSGWVEAQTEACFGDRLELCFAEEIAPDGDAWKMDYDSAGGDGQIQRDVFVLAGKKQEQVHPRFCWHGYRYAEAALRREGRLVPLQFDGTGLTAPGFRADLTSVLVSANHPVCGSFFCSDDLLNWFHHAAVMSLRSNQHCGVPLDCPHRERLGYTGDGQITARAVLLNLDAEAFMRKWMRDILDAQNRKTGHVPHTAPFYNGGGGPGGWGGAMVFVPWELYRHTGQTEILREAWSPMLHWMAYLQTHSRDGLVVREEEGGWCLGDWATPGKTAVEPELVNTALTIRMLEIMLRIAAILGKNDERPALEQERQYRIEAFRRHFYHPETGGYGAERQGAEAFALWCGAVPEEEKNRAMQKILHDLKARGTHFDTGIFGTPILLEILSRAGEADTAFRLMTAEGKPSFRAMREQGATTLYEHWNGGSHNHAMFGSADAWLYEWAAGLAQAENSAGWKQIVLRPGAISLLQQAQATVETPLGSCTLRWKREEGGLAVSARIPCLAQARIELPDGRIQPVPSGRHEWFFGI